MSEIADVIQKSFWWLSSAINGALTIIDDQERLVFLNDAGYKMLQLDSEKVDVIGRPIDVLFRYSGFTRDKSLVLSSLNTGETHRRIRRDTERGAFVLDSTPIWSNGRIIGAASLCYDISNEERMRQDLVEVASRLSTTSAEFEQHRDVLRWLFDSSPVAIVSVDRNSKITSVNRALLRLLDLDDEAALLGQPYSLITDYLGIAYEQSILLRALKGETVLNERRRSKTHVFDASAYSLTDTATGEVMGAFVLLSDITEQSRIDAELTRLDRLNVVGEMAASIAHEIRNPMTTVRGFLQLLNRKPELSPYKHYMDLMIEEIDRANGIISTYLSLSRTGVSTRPAKLGAIVSSFQPVLEAEALLQEGRVECQLNDTAFVSVNESEIKQMLANLVRNALEASPPYAPVKVRTYDDENDQVVLTVSDEGKGIPEELLNRLGTPFLTTKQEGTGLGLAVCYRIAERHNAELKIETSPHGSTFSIHFPRASEQ